MRVSLHRVGAVLLVASCSRAIESAPGDPTSVLRRSSAVVAEGAGWTELPTLGWLGGAGLAAFDGGYVMFGGTDELGSRDRTWVFDGVWRPVQPAHSPSARTSPAMTNYRGRVLLFGGTRIDRTAPNRVVLNDTWEWDGTDWTQRFPAVAPSGELPRMTAVGQGVLLVVAGETWTWDGTSWTRPAVSPTPPRGSTAISAFDGGALLVVGAQTWLWNGTSWSLSTATAPPSYWEPAACETPAGVLLVTPPQLGPAPSFRFTGTTWAPAEQLNASGPFELVCAGPELLARTPFDTLRFDGGTWATLSPNPVPIQSREHALASFDGSVVLFTEGQTWTWRGQDWRRESPAVSPPVRSRHAMTEVAGGVLLFGGSTGAGALSDTWLWDGVTWREVIPPQNPGPVSAPVMTTWRSHAFVFDPTAARTWLWDGGTWGEVAPDASIPRLLFTRIAPFDAGVLLFGGGVDQDETWFFDGDTWARVTTATTPPPRSWHVMANLEGRVVLFGGSDSPFTARGDTWVWDGTDWTEWSGPGPFPRFQAALAAAGDHLVLFGGVTPWNASLRDSWHFRFRGTLGGPCSSAGSCESGFCVDGVCCDSACGGGSSDCQACSLSAGAASDGRCALLSSATICRALRGPCDVAELCSGTSASCPADVVVDGGALCRAAAGACDRAETCDGVATTCPIDRLEPAGVVCRAATCANGAERRAGLCTGGDAGCPSPADVPCAPFACGSTACLSICTDEATCAPGFVCAQGQCSRPLADGNTCLRATQCLSEVCQNGVCCPADGGCPDAGPADGGVVDAGAGRVDGGAPDAGSAEADGGEPSDAGAQSPSARTGCGCGGTGGVVPLALLVAGLLRKRGRRHSPWREAAAAGCRRREPSSQRHAAAGMRRRV